MLLFFKFVAFLRGLCGSAYFFSLILATIFSVLLKYTSHITPEKVGYPCPCFLYSFNADSLKYWERGFSGGPVVGLTACQCRDTCSIPVPGRSHCQGAMAHGPQLPSLCSSWYSRSHRNKPIHLQWRVALLAAPKKACVQWQKDPVQPTIQEQFKTL